MLNRLFLAGAAMLLAAPAFAQTAPTVTTTYASAPTITAGGCTITGATTFQYNPSTNTLVLQNATDSCNGSPQLKTASVTVTINSASYQLGSGAAAPIVSVQTNDTNAQIVCTLTPNNGFTVTGSPVNNSGQFVLSTPTAVGTFSFQPVCATNTTGYNPTVSAAAVSLNVTNGTTTGGGPCSASQTTTVGGVTFQRQCSGQVTMSGGSGSYNGPLTDLGTVLGNKTYPTYAYAGLSPTFAIQSGYYVSLAFVPTANGAIQFVNNASYGEAGIISLSGAPGGLTRGAAGVVCSLNYGSSNSMYISTTAAVCKVTAGQPYYINFADTDANGTFLCYGGAPGSCAGGTSSVSYTLYTSPQ